MEHPKVLSWKASHIEFGHTSWRKYSHNLVVGRAFDVEGDRFVIVCVYSSILGKYGIFHVNCDINIRLGNPAFLMKILINSELSTKNSKTYFHRVISMHLIRIISK